MHRFPCEMSHVPTEQIELMAAFIALRDEQEANRRRSPAQRDINAARTAEDALTAAITAAEARR